MDDQEVAYPFFEKALETGIRNISVHKGLPLPGPGPKGKDKYHYWRPDDVLVAAKDFPDLNFVIYHSGMRHMVSSLPPGKSGIGEDGNIEWTTELVKARKADPSLTNVYAELGTVFAFSVVTHPEITGHLLGQLLDGFGAGKNSLGHRLHLVGIAAVADRSLPTLPNSGKPARPVWLRGPGRCSPRANFWPE